MRERQGWGEREEGRERGRERWRKLEKEGERGRESRLLEVIGQI